MKSALRTAAILLLTGAAGCDSIGEGTTLETLTLTTIAGDASDQGLFLNLGTATERYHMYDCFCTKLSAVATFTDGTLSDFSSRVTFSSSNPAVLTVLNVDDAAADTLCPSGQRASGTVVPHGVGTATITASFAGISDTLVVDVADASAGTYTLEGAAPAPPGSFDVAVGTTLPLSLTVTLDGRTRNLNPNALAWSFDNPDDAVATIDASAVVTGFAPTGAMPKVARASFGVCSDLSPTAAINVGDVLPPLVVEREAPDFATDGMLALDTDERLTITAPLDFNNDGTADGSQRVSSAIELSFTDTCTLRSYDAGVPVTSCLDTPGSLCTDATPTCVDTTVTTCASTMVSCRVGSAAIIKSFVPANRVVARLDNGSPTNFSATYPHVPGTPTDLATAIDAVATTITVTALTGYPATTPWYAVIDAAGTREDVRVTAVTGTTLTVVRGLGGTTAAAHALGATFTERSYTSDLNAPLVIRAKEGELTEVAVDTPGTLVSLGTLQLAARGTFVDLASASRLQRVNRLIGLLSTDPTVVWSSSDNTIAVVGTNTGLVTSLDRCGGRVDIRARASTSTDTTTAAPHDPDTTADDVACENTDPLCDQVEVCIDTPSPLPLGITCDTVTTC